MSAIESGQEEVTAVDDLKRSVHYFAVSTCGSISSWCFYCLNNYLRVVLSNL